MTIYVLTACYGEHEPVGTVCIRAYKDKTLAEAECDYFRSLDPNDPARFEVDLGESGEYLYGYDVQEVELKGVV